MKKFIVLLVLAMVGVVNAQVFHVTVDQDSCAICKCNVTYYEHGWIGGSFKTEVMDRTIFLCDSCSTFWDEAKGEIDKALDSWIVKRQMRNPTAVRRNRFERRDKELIEIREKIKELKDKEAEIRRKP